MSFVGNHVMSSSTISETNGGNTFNRPTTSSNFECIKKQKLGLSTTHSCEKFNGTI